ncbi:hypothetical protein [Virgibacillus doumboii]|uniref:hypothetical protein n=1 Tax=Virgibacillus doumboii TaxID=2697503 RepID=UPI00196864DF|nr:hypothetical protein [Virgibacillus doumboii]
MKKITFIMMVSLALFGCSNADVSQDVDGEQDDYKKDRLEREVIIMDSVDDPLPPEAKNVQSMPSKNEPQQIPNANLNDPIVITKMPVSETEKGQE